MINDTKAAAARQQKSAPRADAVMGKLWRQMSPEQRQAALEAFWRDEEAGEQQLEALALLVQRLKFRPKSVRGLAIDKKVRYLASVPFLSDSITARALVAYHLAQHRPMMGAFLDALGLPHDNGLITEESVTPDKDKMPAAAQAIAAAYPRQDVALYLSTLTAQDPETWGALAEFPEASLEPTAETTPPEGDSPTGPKPTVETQSAEAESPTGPAPKT